MTEEELHKAIQTTVHETLFQIGIAVDNNIDIIEFRKDMDALRDWRLSVNAVKSKGLVAAIGIITAGVLAMLWVGFKAAILGHG